MMHIAAVMAVAITRGLFLSTAEERKMLEISNLKTGRTPGKKLY